MADLEHKVVEIIDQLQALAKPAMQVAIESTRVMGIADDLRDCIAALELDAELNKVRIAELEADLAGWLRWYWDHANGRSAKTRELLFKYTAPETPDPSTRTGPYTGDYDDLRGDRASETPAEPITVLRECWNCGHDHDADQDIKFCHSCGAANPNSVGPQSNRGAK